MDRISGANNVLSGGKRMWGDRNQAAGIVGTFGNALWFNGVQESILGVVEAAGIVPADADNTQLTQAIRQIAESAITVLREGSGNFVVPAGTHRIFYIIQAAGGGGGNGYGGGGGGGGAGAWAIGQIDVVPGASYPYVVGGSGVGGTPGQSSGMFGVSCAGGPRGGPGTTGGLNNKVFDVIVVPSGPYLIGGANEYGGVGFITAENTQPVWSGTGASSLLGPGGASVFDVGGGTLDGNDAHSPGAGGSGALRGSTTAPGVGGPGIIILIG